VTPLQPPARVAALSYSATLGMGLFLSVSAFRDLRDPKSRGVFFSLSGTLGERISATVSRSRQNDVQHHHHHAVALGQLWRRLWLGAAIGQQQWHAAAPGAGHCIGNYGQVTAYTQQTGGQRTTRSMWPARWC
jgi:outer membrane usher protein